MRPRALLALAVLLLAAAPAVTTPDHPTAVTTVADDRAGDWFTVAFERPVTEADRQALVEAGGTSIAPTGPMSWVAWAPHAPVVADAVVTRRTADERLDPWLAEEGVLHLVAVLHASGVAELRTAVDDIADVVDVRVEARDAALAAAYLQTDRAGAEFVAALPAVLHVGPAPTGFGAEDERSAQVVAGLLLGPTVGPPGYEDWLVTAGVTGEGVNVTVVDSGIDPYHPDLAPALVGKVERSQSPTGEPMDGGGHGTHVAGVVAGRGLGLAGQGLGRTRDGGGYLMGLGVAPGAGLVDQNVLGTTAAGPLCGGTWPPQDWEPLTADALALDSAIWNASWQSCEGTGAGYIRSAAEMDRLTRDGDSAKDGAQPFTMVFSAGNSGAGQDEFDTRLTAPKEAKNTIVVASLDVAAPSQVSSFSSRGPARDGRIVPTVAAPGGGVLSTRSTTATASCSTPRTSPALGGQLYASCSGTSMAAPHVAGAVALLTEWWRDANAGADPSPAMAKALLVNTAVDVGTPDIPNRHEGWGRVDLSNLFLSGAARTYVDQSVLLTDPGQQHVETVIVDGESPLRVTLNWTDAPNVPGAERAIVNDLDLELVAPDGTVHLGNVFASGTSVAGGTADRVNTTENVFIADPMPGTWTVRVVANALPGDGDPFRGDATDQDFALVVSR